MKNTVLQTVTPSIAVLSEVSEEHATSAKHLAFHPRRQKSSPH
jgi:hypothetical protein